MNWGKGIILSFILFAGFIGVLVYRMSTQRIDLVRDDYYQDEIAYQRHIDRVNRTMQLKSSVNMTFDSIHRQLQVDLPDSLQTGHVIFYRPDDRRKDVRHSFDPDQDAPQVFSTGQLAKGYWKVQLAWTDGRRDYYLEKDLFIP